MAVKQRSSRKPPGVGRHAAKGDSNVRWAYPPARCKLLPNHLVQEFNGRIPATLKVIPYKKDLSEASEHKSTLKVDWRRIITRIVMMISIMLVVYFTKADKVVPFATQQEMIPKRSVDIACSKDYADELKHFPGCTPVKCGRVVFDSVVTLSEVEALLNIAHRGLSLGGSSGGASILDLHSGALSHGSDFINIYKLEEAKNVFTTEDFKIYSHVKHKIHGAIADHFGISKNKLYLTHPTFFSRIISAPPQTVHDEYWHPHVDKETYKSFHYTSLLYLTDYGHSFDGGRFIFIDKDSNKTVEPRSGRLSAFTSGSENLHYVERVTKGVRYAITVSFTCDPKQAIKDPSLPR